MTERIYYSDPYCRRFAARVVERLEWEGRPALVLDRTAFFPTGGGQPHDEGQLRAPGHGPVRVVDAVERDGGNAVVHLLSAPLAADEVEGEIDWLRRFDLMQQHSGQHILSSAALESCGANTVSFHLTEELATIDLDRPLLSAEQLAAIEARANQVVFENRPVHARFVGDGELASLRLRKPVSHAGPVRIVEVAEFDCSACGGTHVRAAGEVGLIKITRSERRGTELRVEFLCGGRAQRDYAAKNALVMGLAAEFSVGHWELGDTVRRLSVDLQDARRDLRRAREALLDAEGEALWRDAPEVATTGSGPYRLVKMSWPSRSPDELKHLAQRVIAHPRTAVLLGSGQQAGQPGNLVFARSTDVDVPMGTFLRNACELIGGRGGGRPEFAQGGSPDGSRVAEALATTAAEIQARLAQG
ncbi:MAG TPA: DHHA1 domain-containing protein [Anaerolineae bacterium]|nr:DHHA1 domain-containing protein [Anaerolineae bacterium]